MIVIIQKKWQKCQRTDKNHLFFLTEIFRIGNIVFKYHEKCPYRNMAEVVSISLLILNVTKMQKITIIFLAFLNFKFKYYIPNWCTCISITNYL